jgi:hypothetical protein
MEPQRPPLTKLKFIEPMYARLVSELPEGKEWIYQVKLDGLYGDEMKAILYLAVAIATGVAQAAVAASPEEIAQSWKERLSRLDSLKDKQDRKSRYQSLLEFAFAMHATAGQSKPYGLVHKADNGLDFYKIILNKGENTVSKTGLDEATLHVFRSCDRSLVLSFMSVTA